MGALVMANIAYSRTENWNSKHYCVAYQKLSGRFFLHYIKCRGFILRYSLPSRPLISLSPCDLFLLLYVFASQGLHKCCSIPVAKANIQSTISAMSCAAFLQCYSPTSVSFFEWKHKDTQTLAFIFNNWPKYARVLSNHAQKSIVH